MGTEESSRTKGNRNDISPKITHAASFLLKVEHVDVDRRDKHDVENPDIAENPETVIALEDVESVRSGRYSGKDKSGYRRYPEPPEQHGTEQDYQRTVRNMATGWESGNMAD